MNPVALIVEYQTPDLLQLCLTSLKKFAPNVTAHVLPGGPGAAYHARAIELWRNLWRGYAYDPVILLDTDTVILSDQWWPTLERYLAHGYDLVGGPRSRGEACQMWAAGRPVLHASMLAMRRGLFERVPFAAEPVHPELGVVVRDTAHAASVICERAAVLPFYPVTAGPLFPGLQVGEYYDQGGSQRTLWSHLWRGTGMPAGPWWRRWLRQMRAWLGSGSARTMLRAEERKRLWMQRAWEVVNA